VGSSIKLTTTNEQCQTVSFLKLVLFSYWFNCSIDWWKT